MKGNVGVGVVDGQDYSGRRGDGERRDGSNGAMDTTNSEIPSTRLDR